MEFEDLKRMPHSLEAEQSIIGLASNFLGVCAWEKACVILRCTFLTFTKAKLLLKVSNSNAIVKGIKTAYSWNFAKYGFNKGSGRPTEGET